MDELNYFVRDRGLPQELARRLRAFFMHSRDMVRQDALKNILTRLSPDLASHCVFQTCAFLRDGKVFFLRRCTKAFLCAVVSKLHLEQFSPKEAVHHPQTMFIVRRGLAAKGGRILPANAVVGADLILDSAHLREDFRITCLTYVELAHC